MRGTVALGPFALVLAACGLAAAAETPQSSFPLADGNRWTFRSPQVGGPRTMSVERGPNGLVVTGFPGAGKLRVRTAGATVQAWDSVDGRWEALLRFGAPAGSTYRVTLGGLPLWRAVAVTVASKRATIEDYEGRAYRACT